MNKILMAFVAIFITVAASAQSGAGCCAHKAKGSCVPTAEATTTIAPEATADVQEATAPAATAGAMEIAAAATAADAEASVSTPGVPCPNRPGCICPGGLKTASAEGTAPCPNRPGCVCH